MSVPAYAVNENHNNDMAEAMMTCGTGMNMAGNRGSGAVRRRGRHRESALHVEKWLLTCVAAASRAWKLRPVALTGGGVVHVNKQHLLAYRDNVKAPLL